MMRGRGERFGARAFDRRRALERGLEAVVFATIILTSLLVDIQAKESFRYPKELVVRAGCILMAAFLVSATIVEGWHWPFRFIPKRVKIVLAAILTWIAITAVTATNHGLALASIAAVVCYVVFFASTSIVAGTRRSPTVFLVLLTPAAINAVILLLQAGQIWSPFSEWIPMTSRVTLTALLGNVNDVGGYLAPAVLIAAAAGLAMRSKTALAIATVCLAAVIASQTLTAIVAVTAGLIALSAVKFVHRPSYTVIVIALIASMTLLYGPVRRRATNVVNMVRKGESNTALSNRLTAFVAAIEMTRDHPIVGVGPGCYGFNYFDYKIRAEVIYPFLAESMSRATNFAEAHNDHLQIASEIGIPGYLLCLTALIIVSEPSFRSRRNESTAEFARLAALPTAIVLFVSALAHFPLHLATSTVIYVCAFGITSAWSVANAN